MAYRLRERGIARSRVSVGGRYQGVGGDLKREAKRG
jgi:hypothetical protein